MDFCYTDLGLSEHANNQRALVQDVHPSKTIEPRTLLSLPGECVHLAPGLPMQRLDAD